MNWDKVALPVLLFLVAQAIAAVWWASDLSTRVAAVEKASVTDGRIVRLEVAVVALNESNRELKTSIQDLVRELRRNP